jgi:dihydrofolate reductase
MRKVKVFIAMSLDGYIAGPDEDLAFLDAVAQEDEDYGYVAFIQTVDSIVWGRKTIEKVLSFEGPFPYEGLACYAVSRSRQDWPSPIQACADPFALLAELRQQSGQDIYLDGGQLIQAFLAQNLVDEMQISVIPTLLGGGTPLFGALTAAQNWILLSAKSFSSGVVQLHYRRG